MYLHIYIIYVDQIKWSRPGPAESESAFIVQSSLSDLKMQRATKQFSLPDEDSQTAPPIR